MFSITNLTRRNSPLSELRLSKIKDDILGKTYELSLVYVGDKRSKDLNKKYRKKDYPTNVLSFPIEEKSGEVVINLSLVEKQIKKFDMPYKKLFVFLFIHGCLHLKGHDHSPKMDKLEEKYLEKHF